MLTNQELDRVDKYLFDNYCPTQSDMDYFNGIDDFIVDCSLSDDYCKSNAEKLKHLSEEVHRKLCAVFILEDFSPRTLLYQEKYYELRVLLAKATEQDEIKDLAMLCFTESFDLLWLQRKQA